MMDHIARLSGCGNGLHGCSMGVDRAKAGNANKVRSEEFWRIGFAVYAYYLVEGTGQANIVIMEVH